ncbi:EamA-like transporter family protein [Neomoorella glycerini]|uniref:EamA-like transporter family protein n=1 Tax=Neomoorella glycerini TaxID=55779 RepID=A0A6I5ZMY7_9FIRM|nr:DMT family transporter [Moorella glycerini]QGP90949.1 EamA-like transporter family protein [Moorella glycerini]
MALCQEAEESAVSRDHTGAARRLGYAAVLLAALLYGGNVIAGRLVAPLVPPLALAAARGVLGLMVLLPFAWREPHKPRLQDLPYMAMVGFLGISVAYGTFAWSMQNSPALNAAIIFATFPAVTLVLLAIGWHVKPGRYQIAGIIIAFTGLTLVSTQGSLDRLLALRFQPVDLVLLVNVTACALSNILGQKMMQCYSPTITSTCALFFGTLFLLPGGLWEVVHQGWYLPWIGWLLLIYMGCIIAGLAVLLNFEAINRLGCGPVAMFNNLNPLFAIALAAWILKENLSWYHVAGIILVLGGVLISLWQHHPAKETALSPENKKHLRRVFPPAGPPLL